MPAPVAQDVVSQTIDSSEAVAPPLLELDRLSVTFAARGGASSVPAVRELSFRIQPQRTLALVGESGCGKSTAALAIMRLLPEPPARVSGEASLEGVDLLAQPKRSMLRVRGGRIAMIFQEPMTSLNPVLSIGEQIIEAVRLHQRASRREAAQTAAEALHEVGIARPRERLRVYPHQFSGGMRQRVMIAMALACRPQILLADEPTTALDVTIQAQVLDLLDELRAKRGMALLLITHDLGIVADRADDVCVMYAGRVVEQASARRLMSNPLHPYTKALLASRPDLRQRRDRLRHGRELLGDRTALDPLRIGGETLMPWWPTPALPDGGAWQLRQVETEHLLAIRP